MIIPIGHNRTTREWPWVTITLIALCTLVQLYTDFVAPSEDELRAFAMEYEVATTIEEFAVLEARVEALFDKIPTYRWGYETGSGLTINALLSAFVHGGWLHLAGNMLFLWLAGSLIEDRWGRWRYLAFYGAGAVAATLCFNFFYDGDPTYLVGASGAVSATLGAFLVHFHSAKVRFFYFLFFRTGTFEVRAYVALPFWFLDQLVSASLDTDGVLTGTAYTAHVGGFLFGIGVALLASRFAAEKIEVLSLPRATAVTDDSTPRSTKPKAAPTTATPMPLEEDERYRRCMAALEQGETAGLAEEASELVVSLAKKARHEHVLQFYSRLHQRNDQVSLTDSALSEVLSSANLQGSLDLYLRVAPRFLSLYPDSTYAPGVLWRVAELQKQAGHHELARAALQTLAHDHGAHYFGARARDSLKAPGTSPEQKEVEPAQDS